MLKKVRVFNHSISNELQDKNTLYLFPEVFQTYDKKIYVNIRYIYFNHQTNNFIGYKDKILVKTNNFLYAELFAIRDSLLYIKEKSVLENFHIDTVSLYIKDELLIAKLSKLFNAKYNDLIIDNEPILLEQHWFEILDNYDQNILLFEIIHLICKSIKRPVNIKRIDSKEVNL